MSFNTYIDDLGKFSVLKEKMSFMEQLKHIGNYFYRSLGRKPRRFIFVDECRNKKIYYKLTISIDINFKMWYFYFSKYRSKW